MLKGEGSIPFPRQGAVMNTPTTRLPKVAPEPASSFAQEHFGRADLGHKKRNGCLVRVAESICRHPGGSLPDKLGSPTNYKAMDALMNRPEVTHASVLASHLRRTQERIQVAPGVVLLLHDTTELDYSGLSIPELGPIGNSHYRRGYLCHNTLAVDPERREVLGLACQILHARVPVPAGEGIKAKRERQTRESRLWSRAVHALGRVPAGVACVDVADRGADLFEFLATEQQLGRKALVRASQDRWIFLGHEDGGEQARLFTYLRSLPAWGKQSKKIFDRAQACERQAKLAVAAAPLTLPPPHIQKGEYEKKPLRLWGLHIWETQPPKGQALLEWFLLCFEPVTTLDVAWQCSRWYECRTVVEEYHKAQKTGCDIERLQFATQQALQPMIALLSVVAVMLLNLRQAGRRPDAATRPATEVVDRQYEEILRTWRWDTPHAPLSVREFYLALGRLGGHMNRKSDGDPGWLVLWRGWTKLQSMLDGADAERRRRKICRVS
jgi:hypothetical protein